KPAAEVSQDYHICKSDLYKFKRRALAAMREAMRDQPRGARQPHNRLAKEKEQRLQTLCERQPTLSSYAANRLLGDNAPTRRTIQGVRKRLHLPRLSKRPTPHKTAHRFTDAENERIEQVIQEKLYLGATRLSWDLQNQYGLQISASTTKRRKRAILEKRHPPP